MGIHDNEAQRLRLWLEFSCFVFWKW